MMFVLTRHGWWTGWWLWHWMNPFIASSSVDQVEPPGPPAGLDLLRSRQHTALGSSRQRSSRHSRPQALLKGDRKTKVFPDVSSQHGWVNPHPHFWMTFLVTPSPSTPNMSATATFWHKHIGPRKSHRQSGIIWYYNSLYDSMSFPFVGRKPGKIGSICFNGSNAPYGFCRFLLQIVGPNFWPTSVSDFWVVSWFHPWFHQFFNPTGFPPQFHDLFGVFWCFLVFFGVFWCFLVFCESPIWWNHQDCCVAELSWTRRQRAANHLESNR